MYGAVIEKGPQNWQILQQENGFATVTLAGSVVVEDEIAATEDPVVVIRVTDENTNARVAGPFIAKPRNWKWEAEIQIPAGGPYKIETYLRYHVYCELRGDRIFHIGVGDVYLIAGQSNAVGVGKDSVNDPVSPDVHMFRLCGHWDMASHPLHDSTDTLFPLSRERCQTGHSPWLNFGKLLARHLGYPIGLIPGTKGGIPLTDWDRSEGGPFFDNALKILAASGTGKIKGILWYQGCNDACEEHLRDTYYERFVRVCADFRSTFGADLPILTVQLNKVVSTKNSGTENGGYGFSLVREAQRRAMHELAHVYMVPSVDLMVCDGIHNGAPANMVIGERLANVALHYLYGKPILCDAPDIDRAVQEGPKTVTLYFNHVYDMIWGDLNQTEKLMFSLTDEAGRITPCDYNCPGGNCFRLEFDREIAGDAVLSCDGYNDTGLMPYDIFTYLPIIPFHGVKVIRP